jgi:hypothetical protein
MSSYIDKNSTICYRNLILSYAQIKALIGQTTVDFTQKEGFMPKFAKNLMLIIAVLSSAVFSAQAEVRPAETVKVNGLEWIKKSVGLTYDKAHDYCRGFGQGGGGWRLPSLEELRALYGNKKGLGLFSIEKDDPSLWSSHYTDSGTSDSVDLLRMTDGLVFHRHETMDYAEAVCVRSAVISD